MFSLSPEAASYLVLAFLVALIEMTDVFALVYALGAGVKTMRPGLLGAVGGIAVVCVIGVAIGASLNLAQQEFSEAVVHGLATIVLWGFGFVLLRSTLKTYVQEARKKQGTSGPKKAYPPPSSMTSTELTVTGFTVGLTETFEAMVPLLGFAALGYAPEAVVGGVLGGLVLVPIGYVLEERVKRIKVPTLKWVTTSLLLAFAAQWSFEALVEIGITPLPSTESPFVLSLFIPPLIVASLLIVRGIIELWVRSLVPPVREPRGRSGG